MSLTVTVDPSVVPAAVAELLATCKVQVAVDPCVKVPVCALVTARIGAGSIVTASVVELVAVMPPPLRPLPPLFALAGALLFTITGMVNVG